MTIEIRQLSIRTTVVDGRERRDGDTLQAPDLAGLKGELIDACRQLVEEMLLEREER